MKKFIAILTLKKDQRGASLIVVAIALFFLIGFAALAVDFGYSHVVRNQIQNAADAGALAGANDLFNPDGSISTNANQTAYAAATSNKSGGNAVEVNWTSGENDTDIQRGHWTFGNPGVFTENSNTTQIGLFIPNHDYNADPNFINAVKVVTHNTQIPSFFAKIFGYGNYQRTSDAVAIRTAAREYGPGDFDLPIAICWEAISDDDQLLDCNIGRMLNSGSGADTHNTGGWTNFSQPCETANPTNIPIPDPCGSGIPGDFTGLKLEGLGTVGGVQQSVLDAVRDCFFDPNSVNQKRDEDGEPVGDPVSRDTVPIDGIVDRPLYAVLPVILCPGNNISNCAELNRAIAVEIVWISEGGTGQLTAPDEMHKEAFPGEGPDDLWKPSDPTASVEEIWGEFADYFDLVNLSEDPNNSDPAPLQKKAIYFKPSCTGAEFAGTGASDNWTGIFSETSVLVE